MTYFIARNKLILGFVTLNVTAGTAAGILQMIIPLYAISQKATMAQIGLIKGISGLGLLLLVLPAGFLIDHYGSKKLYIFGSLFSAIIVFILTLISSPLMLIFAMGIHGLANSIKFTSLNAAFFKYLNQMGLEKAGWYKGSMSIGLTFIGPLLGGILVPLINFKVSFVLVGLITLLPTIILLFVGEKGATSGKFSYKAIFIDQISGFKAIFENKIIKQTVLTESLSTACFSCFATFIVVLLVKSYNLPAFNASWLIIMEGVAFILTVFFTGPLLNKYKSYKLYLGSFFLANTGLLGIAFTTNLKLLWLSTVIMGVGLGMTNLITYSQVGEIQGEKGKIAGLFASSTGLGATLGPIIGGIIGQRFGIQTIFLSFLPAFVLLGCYILYNQFYVDQRNRVKSLDLNV